MVKIPTSIEPLINLKAASSFQGLKKEKRKREHGDIGWSINFLKIRNVNFC